MRVDVIFSQILNMSFTASIIITFVLLARMLLKRAPKIFSYALWAIVLFRLLCPVSLPSPLSLLNMINAPVTESGSIEYITVHSEQPEAPQATKNEMQNTSEIPVKNAVSPTLSLKTVTPYIWLTGVFVMLVYSLVSLIKLRHKLIGATPLRDNIYVADHISSPFVMGLFSPRIYLPSSISDKEHDYIIRHEQHHIHRFDYIVKILAFMALCLHWFNPLAWVAFILAGNDMEMSCDEAVMKQIGNDIRADYSASLLSFSTGRKMISGTPLAFGEGNTKGRIKNVMNYKKPAFWAVIVATIGIIIIAITLISNPKKNASNQKAEDVWESVTDGNLVEMKGISQRADGRPEEIIFEGNDGTQILEELKKISYINMQKENDKKGWQIFFTVTYKGTDDKEIEKTISFIDEELVSIDGALYNINGCDLKVFDDTFQRYLLLEEHQKMLQSFLDYIFTPMTQAEIDSIFNNATIIGMGTENMPNNQSGTSEREKELLKYMTPEAIANDLVIFDSYVLELNTGYDSFVRASYDIYEISPMYFRCKIYTKRDNIEEINLVSGSVEFDDKGKISVLKINDISKSSADFDKMILKVNDKLYYGTAEVGPMGDAGSVEGKIQSWVKPDEVPTQNGASNFGCVGNPYTYDFDDEGEIMVLLEDLEYHIFRCKE